MSDIVIVSGARTSIGRLGGAFAFLPAHHLGAAAVAGAMARAGVEASQVSEVILGQVLTAGAGQNPARQASVAAGVPYSVPALGVNQVCGSGLRAVIQGYQSLALGDASIVVAGGQENMSQAPHCFQARAGVRLGDSTLRDTLIRDGLWDAFHNYHMGETAENLAREWRVSRAEQDEYAVASQKKAAAARDAGYFAEETVPVRVPGKKGEILVETDEELRPDTSVEVLSKLRTVFQKEGTVTAGNSSGISDGAAALVLMRAKDAEKLGTEPLARIVSWGVAGVEPGLMGIGPVPASRNALNKAGWKLEDLDLIEANEAFAAQCCAVAREIGWDRNKVNVNGGAIALGHPIGASGARILVTLLYELRRRKARKGLATLCIGGGMGIALCVERI